MPAAIPLAIAGASLVAGKLGADASKNAAKTQAASADKALALNSRIYDDQKANMQPFVTGGQSAFANLLNGWQAKQGQPQRPYTPNGAQLAPQSFGAPPAAGGAFGQAMQAPPMMGGGKVPMRAPTGEVTEVDAHLVPQFEARGALRVG